MMQGSTLFPSLDPDLLRAFVTVVDAGGFSLAARRLLRGQSAVSLQIKRLEERLGVALLERSPHHLRLTPKGEAILDQARQILELNAALIARAREADVEGVVRLGAPEDFATMHLPSILSTFRQGHPRIALEVTCELTVPLLQHFASGAFDLAIIKREPSPGAPGLALWREPLVWVGGIGTVDADAPLPLVVSPIPCVYRHAATSSLDRKGRSWRVAFTCTSLGGTHAALKAGLGVSVLPRQMMPAGLTMLDPIENGLPPIPQTEMVLLAASGLNAAAGLLRDLIIDMLARPE
jgi:DNA-binding transcriptional LysR family regulator